MQMRRAYGVRVVSRFLGLTRMRLGCALDAKWRRIGSRPEVDPGLWVRTRPKWVIDARRGQARRLSAHYPSGAMRALYTELGKFLLARATKN